MPRSAPAPKPWPSDAWYIACTPDELAEKPLGRTICGEPMVLYRGKDGKVAALEDFCPHRGAPLSLGFVRDGDLVCGYHGLAMACTGHAASMPGQRVKNFPPIRSYPAIERHGFIWSGRARRSVRTRRSCTRCPGRRMRAGPLAAGSIMSPATIG